MRPQLANWAAWSSIVEGNVLSDLALRKEGEEADRLFNDSIDKYTKAVEIKPDMHEAWNNWGTALSDLARLKDGEEADRLFNGSFDTYAKAVEIKPDMHEAWNNWGTALSDLALLKDGEEADRLFNDSFDMYAKAVEIKPDMHEAWYNWGISLAHMARRKEGEEADRLLEQAREKMSAAEQLSSGYAVYNLARVAALQGDPEEAKEWLLKTREHGKLPTLKHIQEDSDLDSLRDEPWFKELIEELEAGKSSS